jgi:predicted ArsR family transcriptional regulator
MVLVGDAGDQTKTVTKSSNGTQIARLTRAQLVMIQPSTHSEAARADVALDRDLFLQRLVRELTGVLQEVVGLDEAAGFLSVVGQHLGRQIDLDYRDALSVGGLSREQVARVLVDLKRRIQGDFYVIAEDDEKIVLGNHRCPFGEDVVGNPIMCMMTSNVFGTIAASNLGYARVELQETIATGHPGCMVTIHLRPTHDAGGREYFGASSG